MAAWGNLKNIFEKPRTDSFSPWGQHLPSSSPASSFEMFGEFYHASSSPPTSSPITAMPEPDNTAAVEIFGELCYAEKSDFCPNGDAEMANERSGGCGKVGEQRRTCSDVRRRFAAGNSGKAPPFPPPITTIGSGGKPRVYFESFRKDGRFVLREIRIPTQRLLQARREDGRLTMRVLRPREEEEEEVVVEIKEGDEQD